ncbi:MAG: hypothetical protein AAB071_02930 [Bacteroidota bacterium]
MILFIILTILFFVTLIILTKKYFEQTVYENRWKFDSLSNLLQTLFIFVALWFTIFTIVSGNSDTKILFENLQTFSTQFSNMDTSLNDVSIKLIQMPEKIESFSKSINSLNDVVVQQKLDFQKNTKQLNITIKELSNSVSDYEENINNYSSQLKSIVEQTDKQLIIWKEQQRILLEEYSRKPKLKLLSKDISRNSDTIVINDIVIQNDGNIEANVSAIFLTIPFQNLDSVVSPAFVRYKDNNNVSVIYKYNPDIGSGIEIISAGSSIIIPCKITYQHLPTNTIKYQINFWSKYYSDILIDSLMF